MPKVRDITSCSTRVVRELDRQIIYKMNQIIPNCLVSFADLNVKCGEAVWPMLQPAAKEAMRRAIDKNGDRAIIVNSAYRTIAQQMILYNHARNGKRCGIPVAAPPGGSNHQSGLAIDIENAGSWEPYLEGQGWLRLLPHDPVHFDFIRGGTRDIRSLAIKAFQKLWNENSSSKLDEDGAFGPQTALRLGESPSEGFPKGEKIPDPSSTAQAPQPGVRVLRLSQPNMEGTDVRKLQEALVKAGINVEVDGFFGPGTELAVKKFQGTNDLTADGVVGPGTMEKLGLLIPGKETRVDTKRLSITLPTEEIKTETNFTLSGKAEGLDDGDQLVLLVDKRFELARPKVQNSQWQATNLLFHQPGKRLVEIRASEQSRAQVELNVKRADGTVEIRSRSVWTMETTPAKVADLTPKRITIHHTEMPTLVNATPEKEAQRMRDIWVFHVHKREWDDIGYHFVIMPSGRIYIGRPENKRGAHDMVNDGLGIAFDGSYITEKISEAQFDSAVELCTLLFKRYGLKDPVTPVATPTADFGVKQLPLICGHQDRVQTSCPGSEKGHTVRLEEIRQEVKKKLS